MPKILISYRRSDTAGIAGRIFDRLVARFGHESIFMDVDHIPFGTDFRDHIRATLLTGDMLLAIVGGQWLGPRDGERARIHDENDPVRVEIETALQHGVTLIPVLVDGTRMPAPDELPRSLEKFSYLNAAPLDSGRDFHQHMDRLIRSIERLLETGGHATGRVDAPVAARPAAPPLSSRPGEAPSSSRRWLIGGAIAAVVAGIGIAGYGWLASKPASGPLKAQAPPEAPPVSSPMPAPSGPPIRIGSALLQSGPGAAYGREILLAMKIWREDVNVRGGLLGRPVELVAHDDEGNPGNVPGLYARLIDVDNVDLVVSGWPSFLIAPAMPVVAKRNKLFLGLLGLGINTATNYPRYFSMSPTGPTLRGVLTHGLFAVAAAQNPRPRSVAIAAADEGLCGPVAGGARDQAKAAGMPVVYDDTFAPTGDFTGVVRAMAAKSPDLVVLCLFGGNTAELVRTVAREDFRPAMIGGALQNLRTVELKATLGPLLNGWINYEFGLPGIGALRNAEASAVLTRYRNRARDEEAAPLGHQLALWSYARMQVLQQAVEAVKGLDDTRLADYIRGATFRTVVGEVRFGDRGEWAEPRILQVQYQNLRENDIGQFDDLHHQVVIDPADHRSGKLIYPFADARK